MARLLNCNPSAPDTWPTEMIDRLITLEERGGYRALLLELDRLMVIVR